MIKRHREDVLVRRPVRLECIPDGSPMDLEAGSLESALHVENRSQILSSSSGEMRAFVQAFARRKTD